MKFNEYVGDIWDLADSYSIVIPINNDGVMGRGIARQAKDKFLEVCNYDILMRKQGFKSINVLRSSDTSPHKTTLIFMPVKHHWPERASIGLIKKSLTELHDLCLSPGFTNIALPRIGCGFGQLDWEKDVKPLVIEILSPIAERIMLVSPIEELDHRYPESFKPGARSDVLFGRAVGK